MCTVTAPCDENSVPVDIQSGRDPDWDCQAVSGCAASAHQSAFNPPRLSQMSRPSGGKGASPLGSTDHKLLSKEKDNNRKQLINI